MSDPWNRPPRQPQQPLRPQPPAPGTSPLGAQPPRPVSIDSYAPPASKVTPAIVMVVATLSLVIGLLGYRLVAGDPAPSASPSPSAEPTSTRSGGVTFEARNDSATGYWTVTSSRWEGNRLVVDVAVTVDEGQTRPSFYVFGNTDSKVYDPELTAPSPAFGSPTIRSGQTVAGNVVFAMARGPATLVLTDSGGRQISAHAING